MHGTLLSSNLGFCMNPSVGLVNVSRCLHVRVSCGGTSIQMASSVKTIPHSMTFRQETQNGGMWQKVACRMSMQPLQRQHCRGLDLPAMETPGFCSEVASKKQDVWRPPGVARLPPSSILQPQPDKPAKATGQGADDTTLGQRCWHGDGQSNNAKAKRAELKDQPVFIAGKHLSELSTWGIGGPAKHFIEVHTVKEMAQTLRHCHQHGIPFFVVGKGSNCLFDDRGYDGCIILNRIEFVEVFGQGVFRVGSGYPFNTLGILCSRQGFSGLEFACGIPGTVGGAVFMNAGADKQETADVLKSVEILTIEGERRTLLREKGELQYSYRSSPFQHMEKSVVVTAATFELQPCPEAKHRQKLYMDKRRRSQPVSERTAGCVFRNPEGCESAGAVIDQLGLKGHSIGDASVSSLHANFLINKGNSRSADMLALIASIKQQVKAERGVDLHEEILYVPYR